MIFELDTLVSIGSTVKALEDFDPEGAEPIKVGGHIVLFGDPDSADLQGEFFTKATDFGPHEKSRVIWHHARDPKLGRKPLGEVSYKADDVGIWAEGWIHRRDQYEQHIARYVKAGKVGWSTGTAPHLVETRPAAKGTRKILSWPLGLDASITPTPVDPRNRVLPLKALLEPSAKALPEDASLSMLHAAVERLHAILSGSIWRCLLQTSDGRDDRLSMEECRSRIAESVDQYRALLLGAINAFAPGDGDTESMKSLIEQAESRLRTGLRLDDHASSVLAAVAGLADRIKGLAEARSRDGRSLSPSRRELVARLRDDLHQIHAATAPKADPARVRAAKAAGLALEADLAAILVLQ